VYPVTFIRGTTPLFNTLCLNNAGTAGPKTLVATWSEPAAGYNSIAIAYRPKAVPRTDVSTQNWRTSWGNQFANKLTETAVDDGDFVVSPSVLGIVPKVEKTYVLISTFSTGFNFTIDPVKPGNTLIFAINHNTIPTVTDNKSNTYILDAITPDETDFTSGSTGKTYFYRCSNIINEPTTLTVIWGVSATRGISVLEVSGLDNTNPVDSIDNATSAPFLGASNMIRNFTTNNNNCLGLAAINKANSTLTRPDGGWVLVDPANAITGNFGSIVYKPNLGSAGAKTFNYTLLANTNHVANIVTYRPAQPEPIVFKLGTTLKAGTYMIRFRAIKDMPSAKIRLVLTDGVNDLGVSSWTTITTADNYNLYEVPVKISGTCDKIKIEAARLAEDHATTLLVSGI
jgi:hypothetical protein